MSKFRTRQPFSVVWSSPDQTWIAVDPSRPGLVTHADDFADLCQMVAEARAEWDDADAALREVLDP